MAQPAFRINGRTMLACLLLAACRWSHAEVTTVYRCVAADGGVALQDQPCPPHAEQQRARYRAPPPAPVPAPRPPTATPGGAEPPAAVPRPDPVTPPPPPPPLWECVRHDGSRYESATGVPERRWVPLWVLGRDPRAPPTTFAPPSRRPSVPRPDTIAVPGLVGLGPGTWVSDTCVQLPPAQACTRHRERRDALRRRWQLAMPSERDRIRPQERELSAMLRERCGL